MSLDKSRYSLRSQCRDHGACNCRHTPGLPNRSKTSRRGRRLDSFNTNGSDITPSDYSDVGSASDLDDSYSGASSPSVSLNTSSHSPNVRIITINNIHANGNGLSSTVNSPFLHPSFGCSTALKSSSNQKSANSHFSVTNRREIESPVSSRYIGTMSNNRNTRSSSRGLHENLAKFTKFEETVGGRHVSGASYVKIIQKSEIFGNGVTGTSVHQEHRLQQQATTFKSNASTASNSSSRIVTRSGGAIGGGSRIGDDDYLRRRGDHHQETDQFQGSSYKGSSVGKNGDVFSTRRRKLAMAAYAEEDNTEIDEANGLYQALRKLWKYIKVVGFRVYWTLVNIVTWEKFFLDRKGKRSDSDSFLKYADYGGRATKKGRYLYEDDSMNEGAETFKRLNGNGYEATPSRRDVVSTNNGKLSSRISEKIFGSTENWNSSESTVGWLGNKAMYFFSRKRNNEQEEFASGDAGGRTNAQGLSSSVYGSKGYSAKIGVGEYQTKTSSRRANKKQYDWNDGIDSADSCDDEEEEEERESATGLMGICGFFSRLLVLLAVMGLFGYLAYLLWPTAASLASSSWDCAANCLYFVSGWIASALSYLSVFSFSSLLPILKSGDSSMDRIQVPSKENIHFEGNGNAPVYESSKSNAPYPTVSAISVAEYNAILTKLQAIEETLEKHKEKLARHDINFNELQQQIMQLDAAMRAASMKGKTSEQILMEVMNFKLGESSDGKTVTLTTLMSILNESEQKSDEELNLKLQDMAAKLTAETASLKRNLNEMEINLHQVKVNQETMKLDMPTTTTATAEVDPERIKDIILPVLMSEMEKQVKISCLTRNCPDPEIGVKGSVPSSEDIEKLISIALAKYDADKTGLADLALEPAGGSILSTRCTKSSKLRNSIVSIFGFGIWSPPNNPRTIIQPGVVPGECWAFEGSIGDVVIKLVGPSIVTGFTMEHIPKSVSPYNDIRSAPYKFQVLGLNEENDFDTAHDYGIFSYEDNLEAIQFFPAANITSTPYPIVELKILSNHGNLQHTCLYRFRVHGTLALDGSKFTAHVQTDSETEV